MNTMRNYARSWKQDERMQREAAAIRAMYWILMALLVGTVMALLAGPARADASEGRGEQVAFLAALAVIDYGQSVEAFYHEGRREINPLLGEKPSRRDMAAFGIAGWAAMALIGSIDHPLARIAVDSIVASEQFNVEENVRVANGRGRRIHAIPIIVAVRF